MLAQILRTAIKSRMGQWHPACTPNSRLQNKRNAHRILSLLRLMRTQIKIRTHIVLFCCPRANWCSINRFLHSKGKRVPWSAVWMWVAVPYNLHVGRYVLACDTIYLKIWSLTLQVSVIGGTTVCSFLGDTGSTDGHSCHLGQHRLQYTVSL